MSWKEWLTKNTYATMPGDPDAFFRPRKYGQAREEVARKVQEALASLRRWKVVEYRENQGRLHAAHTTRVLRFVDDVNIYMVQGMDGLTKLEAVSRSRVGKGDLGQNKRNLRELLARLDEVLPPLKP